MTASKPGYDGHEPVFMPARDIESRDRMTGRIVREVIDGPENVNSTRIRAMQVRKRLTDRQAAAASRYQDDWQLSMICPTASAGGTAGGGGVARSTLPDAKLDAMDRHAKARRAMGGRCAPVVDLVALENKIVEVAANELRIHNQKATAWLEVGLDLLADHYRIPPELPQ
jgi:hypothetical protein